MSIKQSRHVMSTNNNVTSFDYKTDGLKCRMYLQRKRKVDDENMMKYDKADVNCSIMCKFAAAYR